MNIIVQKFGGTSLAAPEAREQALIKIRQARQKDLMPVVVVSAMGRNGAPYATDTLKNLVAMEGTPTSQKNLDLLLSCGEIISAVVVSDLLEAAGHPAVALTGWQAGIVTDDHFGEADILNIENEKLLGYLEQGIIPVVTGFQGINARQEITTLGRGGSDTTAVALGAALKAECVEIYTDVNGIMTADPRVVPQACMLDEIHYDEIFQMADQGAKVIHPRAVEIARQNGVTLRIRNTMSDHPGTLICGRHQTFNTAYTTQREELLTAITQKDGLTRVVLVSQGDAATESLFFDDLAAGGISIDMINFSTDQKAFVIDNSSVSRFHQLMDSRPFTCELFPQVSKVTIIGNRMTGIPGVMATVMRALTDQGIPLLQSSDSHATISCLVPSSEAHRAVQALHQAFGLDRRKSNS
ncbi:aspartate kinase [Anoxynatronum buryatiense]|uniref:aspartate kinase n=1 Tax=Anoxynatronum buryatiense TaxID=489973 RepID=UPI0024B68F3D|nr:aspartate kinase [Anoxynatronum buryatiense]